MGGDISLILFNQRPSDFSLLTTGGDSDMGLPGLSLVDQDGSTDNLLQTSRSISEPPGWAHDLDFYIRYDGSDFDTDGTIAIQVPATLQAGGTDDLDTGTETITAVVETTPAQVMGVNVTPGAGQLQVTWTAVDGVTGYKVQWKSGSEMYSTTTRQTTVTDIPHTITGLIGGTAYTVRVIATNSKAATSDGPVSDEVTGTPGLGQVMGVSITPGREQLQVTWTAVPGVTNYRIQWKSGSQDYANSRAMTTASTSYSITGLTGGTEYTVQVVATQGILTGPASAELIGVPIGDTDYDQNNNGLIDVTSLAQLNVIRFDLDGNGSPTGNVNAYNLAFAGRATDMGCPTSGCRGYELMNDLDFDENGNGLRDDDYNTGSGWMPIGTFSPRAPFVTTFNGNGQIIANLYINRGSTEHIGLFGYIETGSHIINLGITNVEVIGFNSTGGLVGWNNTGAITTSHVNGRVQGNGSVGGLVGMNRNATITASYANGQVQGTRVIGGLVGTHQNGSIIASYAMGQVSGNNIVGGLVGDHQESSIIASYAMGQVSGNNIVGGLVGINTIGTITTSYAAAQVSGNRNVGGLVGTRVGAAVATASYWDTGVSGQMTSASGSTGQTTVQLQVPTGYTGIYADWNLNLDGTAGNDTPWAFGDALQYPILRYRITQAQVQAQFDNQILRIDIDGDSDVDQVDAMLMYQTYLRVPGVNADLSARAAAWRQRGQPVGGDLNSDRAINAQDALIMYYAYEFGDLLNTHPTLQRVLLNGVRGRMPDNDAAYQQLLRRARQLQSVNP